MNLQPFYDVRERLALTAAAGTQLIQEDFRLREAVKKLDVYAKASPVFAKMSQMAGELLNGPEEGRTGTLLDLLGLVDAFLITQGTTQIDGELQHADESSSFLKEEGDQPEWNYREIPYSKLQPLRMALSSAGGGRQALLEAIHDQEPELLQDYRIRPLLVRALGDSYSELADMVCRWIIEMGSPMLPLLMKGFCPDGKRDMVRRVKAISAIAGGAANGFYQQHLEESKKDVREALIAALHDNQDNTQLLLDLLKTEKGKPKKAVLWSLSFMEDEQAEAFWKQYAFSSAGEAAEILKNSDVPFLSGLLASAFRKAADELENHLIADAEEIRQIKKGMDKQGAAERQKALEKQKAQARQKKERLNRAYLDLLDSLKGKTSKEIRDAIQWAASKESLSAERKYLSAAMMETIFATYQKGDTDAEAYCQLANRLFDQYGISFFEPVFAAAVMSWPAEQVYDTFQDCFQDQGILKKLFSRRDTVDWSRCGVGLFRVIQKIYYKPEMGYGFRLSRVNDYSGEVYQDTRFRRLPYGLDLRWYALLMKNHGRCPDDFAEVYTPYSGCDAVLYRLMRTDKPEICQLYCWYYGKRALQRGPSPKDVEVLKACGFTEFNGFIVEACRKMKQYAWIYQISELIKALPITTEQLKEELETVQKEWRGKKVNGSSAIDHWLEQINNGASKDGLF